MLGIIQDGGNHGAQGVLHAADVGEQAVARRATDIGGEVTGSDAAGHRGGNRRVTADALGPRTVQKIFVTMGAGCPPVKGIRPVAAVAPGVSASTGLSLQQLAGALVREVRPTALICVDSLCSSEPQRLGRTLQFSDTGLCPAQPGSSKHLDAARLGLPVIAAGIPTLMMAQEGKDLVVTPRELDSVIAHGAALLGAAINRALQPRLSIAQLCWLVG